MSLKAVELQIAIPRTHEASKIQEQLEQRASHDQSGLGLANQKELEQKRSKSEMLEKSTHQGIRQQGDGSAKGKGQNPSSSFKKKQENDEKWHPYKGKHIDLSL